MAATAITFLSQAAPADGEREREKERERERQEVREEKWLHATTNVRSWAGSGEEEREREREERPMDSIPHRASSQLPSKNRPDERSVDVAAAATFNVNRASCMKRFFEEDKGRKRGLCTIAWGSCTARTYSGCSYLFACLFSVVQ
jgi:hypothetical protein